jgi:parallel beta-helix repeat protein
MSFFNIISLQKMKNIINYFFGVIACVLFSIQITAHEFIHPGIDQDRDDLNYMKEQVLNGAQPWKDAFERLKAQTDPDFKVMPFTHVIRGPYGRPNIGGDELSKGVNMAYNNALLWFITEDRGYARKAIGILNAWSQTLWDFDYNDAKLLAGWTGHLLCNAAEILRYSDSGWNKEDQERFSRMLMTVYYPLLRYYYPQANGNWDGAIIHSLLAIAVYTDNEMMFNNAIAHFLYSPVNGSIFKYIYPSGQCQESTRDQGHVQLGLGEFAGAARIAFTQGVDLFSLADNRIALGYEYTASFLLGNIPHCYGRISERAKNLSDIYEYVYRHYTAQGIKVHYTKMAADSIRPRASRAVLTAFRAPKSKEVLVQEEPQPCLIAWPAGAMQKAVHQTPPNAIRVSPGQSLQSALDKASGEKGWVIAGAGVHKFADPLKIPSGVTLSGEGLRTILLLDPASGKRDALVNGTNDLHDVTICDLVIEGALDPEPPSDPNSNRSFHSRYNRGGIIFLGNENDQMKNITLKNITVRNCTYNGVFICGATEVKIESSDFNENGARVVPGEKLQHNLLLTHCSKVVVKDSRLDTSPCGSGVALANSNNVVIKGCEIARNGYYGTLIRESNDIEVSGCLIEGNDFSGIMAEFLYDGCRDITIRHNRIHYNNGYGIETYAARNVVTRQNRIEGNKKCERQKFISKEKYIIGE